MIPAYLKTLRNWLVWKLTTIPGEEKPRKIPYYANGKVRKSGASDDRDNLVTFDEAERVALNWSGYGFALFADTGVTAVDFDYCVDERGLVDPRVLALVAGTYAELSPSGRGVRAFFKGTLQSRKDNDPKDSRVPEAEWFAVEFFGTSGYVTVTGNVLEEAELFGYGVEPLTDGIKALFEQRFGPIPSTSLVVSEDDTSWMRTVAPKQGLSLEEAKAIVFEQAPDCGYGEWLAVAQALHHEFDGAQAAYDIFVEWSEKAEKPATRRVMEQKWRSFGNFTGSPRTMAGLVARSKQHKNRESFDAVAAYKETIAACQDEFTLREQVCATIARDTRLAAIDREGIAQALSVRFRELGTKYPIAQVRKLLVPRTKDEKPEWASDWVYVTEEDKFYRLDTEEWLSRSGFDAKYNRLLPRNDEGVVTRSASDVALEDVQIKVVTRALYLPWAGPEFNMHGVECVNRYRPSSVPLAVDVLSAKGKQAIAAVERHISLVCGGRAEVIRQLTSFLAFCVQKPGVKVRWAPLIKGVEGDGKTLVGKILAVTMGQTNVKNVSPKVLGTDFSGWAEGACVRVLEELKLTGHNRHDILNALKPYITNDSVPVHRKGKDEYEMVNTTNYVAFTNFSDALPLSDTDRRWFIIFTPWNRIEDMPVEPRYFDQLHDLIAGYPAELRRWLLDYKLADDFYPNGRAPHTAEKDTMIALGASEAEDLVRECIETGAEGVCSTVLSSSCLTTALSFTDMTEPLQTSALYRLLVKMGWSKVPRQIKWNGKAHRLWTRGGSACDPVELRDALDKTIPENARVADAIFEIDDDLF